MCQRPYNRNSTLLCALIYLVKWRNSQLQDHAGQGVITEALDFFLELTFYAFCVSDANLNSHFHSTFFQFCWQAAARYKYFYCYFSTFALLSRLSQLSKLNRLLVVAEPRRCSLAPADDDSLFLNACAQFHDFHNFLYQTSVLHISTINATRCSRRNEPTKCRKMPKINT